MGGLSMAEKVAANKFAEIVTSKPQKRQAESPTPIRSKAPAGGPTKHIGGHFPPETLRQFRILCAEQETNGQALLEEALNLLFDKYGKPALTKGG